MSVPLGRAILAFLALPGTVAFIVPWLLSTAGQRRELDLRGLIPLSIGIAMLLWCVWAFYTVGKGTLAPWAPPRHLVTVGLFAFSRNPIYIAVMLILCGWAWAFRSRTIAVYAVLLMVGFHLRVLLHEEPYLTRTHGDAWVRYKGRVPRWLGFPRR